jgi:xylan 1,4-beta-xylosidase
MRRLFLSCFFSVVFFQGLKSQTLVLPGDHPDPSVVKIGDEYWASATTSNWFPAFPLMRSKDLVHWKQQGYVLNRLPEWADYYFWAPEISYDRGKVYVYYAAHKKNGNLCVGVASADRPEGPYTDHGPLVCQEDGSIDAFPMRDENGKLYLIWKEDANSIGKPTPIWAQEMNEARTTLTGTKKELFRNELPWEGNLVEGVSMMRHADYFYAFYAGAGCCGLNCNYGVGIARSKSLLGPWEKYQKNPVLQNMDRWSCPGHGTPIEKDGRYYFLFHAYDRKTNVFTGRQGLLMEFNFTPDGWVVFLPSQEKQPQGDRSASGELKNQSLSDQWWQWSVFQDPHLQITKLALTLEADNRSPGVFIGQRTLGENYTAEVEVKTKITTAGAGLGAIGDEKNLVMALYEAGQLSLVSIKDGKETKLLQRNTVSRKKIFLRMQVRNSKEIYFFYSADGKRYTKLNETAIDGSFLPPWDRGVRAGLVSRGDRGRKAVFGRFGLSYQ